MRKNWILAFSLLLGAAAIVTSQVVIMQRPLSNLGLSAGVGYGTTEPTIANAGSGPIDGELFVVRNAGTADPDLKVYSQVAGAWTTALVTGGTDAVNLSTSVTIGSNDADDITINGPATFNVIREDFSRQTFHLVEEDYTAAVVTDVGENYLILPGSQLGLFWYSYEQAFGGTVIPFTVAGVLDISGFVDAADTDGIDFTVGGDPVTAIYYDEDNSSNTYCEMELSIATIANIDEFYFGWRLNEARAAIDANAVTGANTAAYFRVPDNAGDLDVETELNGGGTLNADTGITWVDAASHTMRVTLLADTVTFTLDGAAVAQGAAVLNLDATDRMVCFFGSQMSAVGATAGLTTSFVEVGVSQ